jgi:predicted aspartyl protease
MTMKTLWCRVLGTLGGLSSLAVILTVKPSIAMAQTPSCYMLTTAGQQLNLGTLCGEAQPVVVRSTPKSTTGPKVYRVKIKKRLAATPVIDVAFNGKLFEMILDTGASSTLITQAMATALRIPATGYREVIVADGSTLKFPITTVKAVNAGGVVARNLEVTIADKADVGLLGQDFFGKYDVKIKRNVIEFSPPTGD